ncbi:MAG: NAD(P)H-hydrate dehydratase [Moraxellaceae bacterium]|nr:NAD(P)H-hydrate dehydratase [Moraxellaceae bacterium]
MTYSNPHTALYTSKQVYQIEKQWFEQGNDSFFLMQQASWQMACFIEKEFQFAHEEKTAIVWVGNGNNGGDGWLIANYLLQFNWQVQVVEVAQASTKDSQQAKAIAMNNGCIIEQFHKDFICPWADVYIDALFGIGLDRIPTGNYQQAILAFNKFVARQKITAVAVDIPSGLVASTGQVFQEKKQPIAIKAEFTLCLIAYKLGLFLRDGREFSGKIELLPLIPLPTIIKPSVKRINNLPILPPRKANSHKGNFGHLLIIGGNQGMGGASILATQGAFAVGVGKLSVACYQDYHGALLTHSPNAMSLDLHDMQAVSQMITQVDMVAIGMGLGRNIQAKQLFNKYLTLAMQAKCDLLLDADALYHLASVSAEIKQQLINYAQSHFVAYTPHSGEMARLLAVAVAEIENDPLSAITQAHKIFGGNWLLKGAGSFMIENNECYLCDAGNANMATAGMGDVLAGIIAGLQVQKNKQSLTTGVLLHALTGDYLAEKQGQGLQAQDMAEGIHHFFI